MAHIVLTEEQARAIRASEQSIDLRDPSGQVVAIVRPLDENESKGLEILRRRRASANPEPGIPAARISAMLAKLNELDTVGEVTPERVAEVVRRVRQGEEP